MFMLFAQTYFTRKRENGMMHVCNRRLVKKSLTYKRSAIYENKVRERNTKRELNYKCDKSRKAEEHKNYTNTTLDNNNNNSNREVMLASQDVQKIEENYKLVNGNNNYENESNESYHVTFSPTSEHDKAALESTHSSKYRILCHIGRGSFGSVYLVENKLTGCTFALKYIVCENDTRRTAALHEVEIINVIQGHPNIIKIIDMFMNYEFYSHSSINHYANTLTSTKKEQLELVNNEVNCKNNRDSEINNANNVNENTHELVVSELKEEKMSKLHLEKLEEEEERETNAEHKTPHWAYLHLPTHHIDDTVEGGNYTKTLSRESSHATCERDTTTQQESIAANNDTKSIQYNPYHYYYQGCEDNIDDNITNKKFTEQKILSEADTECLMREAELILLKEQRNLCHIKHDEPILSIRPRKAEEVVSMLTNVNTNKELREEYTSESAAMKLTLRSETNNVHTNNNNDNDATAETKKFEHVDESSTNVKLERTPSLLHDEEKQHDKEEIENSTEMKKFKSVSSKSSVHDRNTSESNSSRNMFKQQLNNSKWNTKLRNGANIAPPRTSYAPRRVRYVDFDYPRLVQDAPLATVNNTITQMSVCTVEKEEVEKRNSTNRKELQETVINSCSNVNGKCYCNPVKSKEFYSPANVSLSVPLQNFEMNCQVSNEHKLPSPSPETAIFCEQNSAVTYYRNFVTDKLSTKGSSSKSTQTAEATSHHGRQPLEQKVPLTRRRHTIMSNNMMMEVEPHSSSRSNVNYITPSMRTTTHQTFTTFSNNNNNTNNNNNNNNNNNVKIVTDTTKSSETYISSNNFVNNTIHQIQHTKEVELITAAKNGVMLNDNATNKHPGCLCLVMEYHPMGDLAHYVLTQHELLKEEEQEQEQQQQQQQEQLRSNQINPLTEPQLLSIAYQLSSVLEYLHSRNPIIIHRDLKPENILIKGDASVLLSRTRNTTSFSTHDNVSESIINGRIYKKIIPIVVTDFGLAITQQHNSFDDDNNVEDRLNSAEQREFTHRCNNPRRTGRGGGTRPYISPESWLGETSTASDMWSLGCVLYALATCRVAANTVRLMSTEAKKPGFAGMILNDILEHNYSLMFGSFILSLLVLDPSKRLSASSALKCFTKVPNNDVCDNYRRENIDKEREKDEEEEVCFDANSPFFTNVFDLE